MGVTKLTGCCTVDALEQPIEMRNIGKASSKSDFRNLPVSRIVEQITCAGRNPFVVDVLSNRASRPSKRFVYVTLRAMKFSRRCYSGEIRCGTMTINMIHHHQIDRDQCTQSDLAGQISRFVPVLARSRLVYGRARPEMRRSITD
jgi:hypothetical protein